MPPSPLPRRRGTPALALLGVLLLAACGLAACGGSSDAPTAPGPGPGPTNGSMTARVDGADWSALSINAISTGSGTPIISIGAANTQLSMGFAWIDQGTGTYRIGESIGMNATLSNVGGPTLTWTAAGTLGSGTLTVTSRTAQRVAGTFSFTVVPGGGSAATGTRQITNGAFDVRFP